MVRSTCSRSTETSKAVSNDSLMFSVSGTVTYADDFQGRWSTFCFYWERKEERFADCPGGNLAP